MGRAFDQNLLQEVVRALEAAEVSRKAEGETAGLREELAKARAANDVLAQQLFEARQQRDAAVQQKDAAVQEKEDVWEVLDEYLFATGFHQQA